MGPGCFAYDLADVEPRQWKRGVKLMKFHAAGHFLLTAGIPTVKFDARICVSRVPPRVVFVVP